MRTSTTNTNTVELKTRDSETPHELPPGGPDRAVAAPQPKPRRLPSAAGAHTGRYQCACCVDPDPAASTGTGPRRQHRRVVLAWRTRLAERD
ncbi:MAG: hypothetical protein Q8R67_17095 [Rhodoferax sp.]|nr:hypothetical protein [Rhodoferax sp.]MDP3653385.1 hypothetical protein [Rhodoferax sp.]